MRNIYKIFFFLVPAILSVLFVLDSAPAQAQQQTACDVNLVYFRTTRAYPSESFYVETNAPFAYIDISTSGCVGQTIQVSVTEDDDFTPDDDLNGVIGVLDPCNNNSVACMDNRIISVPADNFTLVLRVGEEECEQMPGANNDCHYHVETTDAVNGWHVWDVPAIVFDCDGACDTFWQYLGFINPFMGTHADDPDDNYNPNNQTGGNGGNQPGDVNISGGEVVIDLNLPNPLAGTIDTIPQLFQKIVEIIIKIGIPLVAMAIVYSGLLFVTARGSDEQIKKAKNAFAFAVIGGLILLASWLVAEAIRDALTSFN